MVSECTDPLYQQVITLVATVYFNLSKTFDTVSPNFPEDKLAEVAEFPSSLLKWLKCMHGGMRCMAAKYVW